MNSKGLTLLLIVAGLLFAALITRSGDLAWMALPFLAYLGMGILQSPSAENIRLRAGRSVEKTGADDAAASPQAGLLPPLDAAASPQAGLLPPLDAAGTASRPRTVDSPMVPAVPAGAANIIVRVTVSNQGAALDRLELTDPPLPGMRVDAGQMRQHVALPAGESVLLEYTFPARRGTFAWETVRAVVSDPFGLVEIPLNLPAAAHIQVQPELRRFRPFPLRPQRTLHSAGAIPARLGGSGTDFWGIREYQPGDPLRRLDWRLAARHPRKFFTKEFEQEEIADIGLILDARQKTDLRVGEDSLFEHSARAAASVAEVLLRQGNRVSLLVYGKTLLNVYPGYGKVQLNRILRALAQASTAAEGSLDSLQYIPVHLFSSHSLILIFSPLAANDWRLFPRLRAYGYQVLLVSPNPVEFFLRTNRDLSTDPVTGLAVRLAGIERHLEIARITRLWIPVIDWQVDQPLSPLVRSTLSHLHIQQQR